MGQEIADSHFTRADFDAFAERLRAETELLVQWFRDDGFSRLDRVVGFELEAWLTDESGNAAPVNDRLLERMNDPLVVPELARFNVEINGDPQPLAGRPFSAMQADMARTWGRCQKVGSELGVQLMMIGILPTVREDQLTQACMSDMKRYEALNEQVLRQRGGEPLHLDIRGQDHLTSDHHDVMLESATTSFQIHYKVAPERAVRVYNLAQILSGPMVAVSANSPFLFGADLWDETRIPLFEQSVELGGFEDAAHGPVRRVSFGSGYARESLGECFVENLRHFPVLLPTRLDAPPEALACVRLHNGTIWRWNRPLIGFDSDGRPHLRIEHRVVPGGPTIIDAVANAALFCGLVEFFSGTEVAPELQLPFPVARDNFYACARAGLDAQVAWLDGRRGAVLDLLLDRLLPAAHRGLEALDITEDERTTWLAVIEGRLCNRCNGAAWQRAWVARHGPDMQGLTLAYRERQDSGLPVHQWDF